MLKIINPNKKNGGDFRSPRSAAYGHNGISFAENVPQKFGTFFRIQLDLLFLFLGHFLFSRKRIQLFRIDCSRAFLPVHVDMKRQQIRRLRPFEIAPRFHHPNQIAERERVRVDADYSGALVDKAFNRDSISFVSSGFSSISFSFSSFFFASSWAIL